MLKTYFQKMTIQNSAVIFDNVYDANFLHPSSSIVIETLNGFFSLQFLFHNAFSKKEKLKNWEKEN